MTCLVSIALGSVIASAAAFINGDISYGIIFQVLFVMALFGLAARGRQSD